MRKNRIKRLAFFGLVMVTIAAWGWVGWRFWLGSVYKETRGWAAGYGGVVFWSFESHRLGVPSGKPLTPKSITEWVGVPLLDDIEGVLISGSPGISTGELNRLRRLPRLHWLTLSVSTLDDEHVKVITKLKGLEDLSIGGGGWISNDGLALIGKMPNLKSLYLEGSAFNGEGLKYLAELSNLEELTLNDSDIRDGHLVYLAGLKRLRFLDLSFTGIEGSGLAHLSQLDGIETLFLANTQIDDSALEHFRGLKNLTELGLGEGITDQAVSEILRHRNLKTLRFFNSDVSDEAIDQLVEGLDQLKNLSLYGTLITGQKIGELEKRGLEIDAAF